MKKLIALLLAMTMLFALVACGGGNEVADDKTDESGKVESGNTDKSEGKTEDKTEDKTEEEEKAEEPRFTPIEDLVVYQRQGEEMGTFNILYTQSFKELMPLTNCVDALLTNDNHAQIIPGLAESWEASEGSTVYTFTIRDGATWVDYKGNYKADVIAEDFATAIEWTLNYYKNESVNTSTYFDMIVGAEDYYNYTKELAEEEALALDLTKFYEICTGVAVDGNKLIFTCTYANTFIPSIALQIYPLSAGVVAEMGGAQAYKAANNTQIWYCGPYTMTTYVQDNEKVLTKNESWWGLNEGNTVFNTVTTKMVESHDIAYQMYCNGELDQVTLSLSTATVLGTGTDPNSPYITSTPASGTAGSMHLNWHQLTSMDDDTPNYSWNTALANENFRKALYWGLDWTSHLKSINTLNPYGSANYTYNPPNFAFYTDGTDYADKIIEGLGFEIKDDCWARLDVEKALEYKEKALEELTAKGVEFPIIVRTHVAAGDQNALDSALLKKQMFEEHLGADFITLEVGTYIKSFPKEIRTYGIHGMTTNSNGAGIADPYDFLSTETYGESSYWANRIARVDQITDPELIELFTEFTRLVNEANAIKDDQDARLDAFVKAELFALDHALLWPTQKGGNSLQLTKINDYTKALSAVGSQSYRYINLETSVDGFTTEDYEMFKAEWEASKP